MFGTINALQESIVEKLRTSPWLSKFRILKEECLSTNSTSTTGNTTSIVVKIPLPLAASSSFSNFNFSKISISVEINSPRHSAGNIYSPISIAEYISKDLHSWQASTGTGHSTISINQENPWQEYTTDEQTFSITLNFISQSISQ